MATSSDGRFWPKILLPLKKSASSTQASPGSSLPLSSPRSKVADVYLSTDASSAHGFVVTSEFDYPIDGQAATELDQRSSIRSVPTVASSDYSSLESSSLDRHSSYTELSQNSQHRASVSAASDGSVYSEDSASVSDRPAGGCAALTSSEENLEQRLSAAYDRIRSMPSPVLSTRTPTFFEKYGRRAPMQRPPPPPPRLPPLPNPHPPPRPCSQPASTPRRLSDAPECPDSPLTSPIPSDRHGSALAYVHALHTDASTSAQSHIRLPSSSHPLHLSMSPGALFPSPPPLAQPRMAPASVGGALRASASHPPTSARYGAAQIPFLDKPPTPMHKKLTKHRSGLRLAHSASSETATTDPGSETPFKRLTSLKVKKSKPSLQTQEQSREHVLPPIRSPSPIRLNIPTHQAWHDRRTKFSPSSYVPPRQAPNAEALQPHRLSASTDALASLAWIGTAPSSVYASPIPDLRQRLTRATDASGAKSHGRFTLVSGIGDEELSDEVLVEKLEMIRRQNSESAMPSPTPTSVYSSRQGFGPADLSDRATPRLSTSLSSISRDSDFQASSTSPTTEDHDMNAADSAVWNTARRALLCVREIVRTERKYQEGLQALLDGDTLSPPPHAMLSYIPPLLRASHTMLKGFTDDPSAWGVSITFIACEDELESAMIAWSGVVGEFFGRSKDGAGDNASPSRRWSFRKSLNISTSSGSPSVGSKTGDSSSGCPTPPVPPLLTLMTNAESRIKERQQSDAQYRRGLSRERRTLSDPSKEIKKNDSEIQHKKSSKEKEKEPSGREPPRKLTVRDLAIQPTQRVVRYVLLYKELLEYTPVTSPSRALVERALEAAARIARKCDRAQGNVAFVRRS